MLQENQPSFVLCRLSVKVKARYTADQLAQTLNSRLKALHLPQELQIATAITST